MFVGLMCLGDRPRPEDNRGNAALVDQMAHVATEGSVGDLAVAAAFDEQFRGLGGNDDVLALARAVVVMQKGDSRRIPPSKWIGSIGCSHGLAKAGHDLADISDRRSKIRYTAERRFTCGHGFVKAAGDPAKDQRERSLHGIIRRNGRLGIEVVLQGQKSVDQRRQNFDGASADLEVRFPIAPQGEREMPGTCSSQ